MITYLFQYCFKIAIIVNFLLIGKSAETTEERIREVNELIEQNDYNAETHYVTTADGYILALHRIKVYNGIPVLLQHGIGDSSAGFLFMGPQISLAYLLADLGYDVWLGNSRGNRYSRNHTYLNPDVNLKYWDFSWHEMGIYDLPATIDYILEWTNRDKLYYIGHSQGCTSFLVMCSMIPQYNNKIISMHALAPASYLTHTRSGWVRAYELVLHVQPFFHEVFNSKNNKICLQNQNNCILAIEQVFGSNPSQFNASLLSTYLKYVPAGISNKQMKHFFQIMKSQNFANYDYGYNQNIRKYGSINPPKYDLSNVLAPVFVYYSTNDLLVDYMDVLRLYSELGQPVGMFDIPNYTHMDYLWANNLRSVLHKIIVENLSIFI